jgi:hypothetical protein
VILRVLRIERIRRFRSWTDDTLRVPSV